MGSARFCIQNRLLALQSLTSSSEVPQLPIANLTGQQGSPSTGYQSQAGTLETAFTADAGAPVDWQCCGLFRTNLTSGAKVRIVVANNVGAAVEQPADFEVDFDRNFVPPAGFSFTRADNVAGSAATTATCVNASGAMVSVAPNTIRLDHSPVTGILRGLLVEGGRTNSIRAPRLNLTGTVGILGSGGVLPTNMSSGAPPGVTRQFVRAGVSYGCGYIDVRFYGNPTSSGSCVVNYETSTGVAGTVGQVWTASAYVGLVPGEGSLDNVGTCGLFLLENNSAGTFLTQGATVFTPSIEDVSTQRFYHTRTLTNATTAFIQPAFQFTVTAGLDFDVTVRLSFPQLEFGASMSSQMLPPTSGVASRAADAATQTLASMGWSGTGGTLCVDYYDPLETNAANATMIRALAGATDGSSNNREILYLQGTVGTNRSTVAGTGNQTSNLAGHTFGTTNRYVYGWTTGTSGLVGQINTSPQQFGTAATLPTTASLTDGMRYGGQGGVTTNFYGNIRRLRYYASRLSNAQVSTLATYGTLTDASDVYDSGYQVGTVTAGIQQSVSVFPSVMTGRYLRVEVSDLKNSDNFISIPLAVAGPLWTPSSNIRADSNSGMSSGDVVVVTQSGSEHVTQYSLTRTYDFSFSGLSDDEIWNQVAMLIEVSRLGKNILFISDHNSAMALSRLSVFGRIKTSSDISYQRAGDDVRSWRGSIAERQ